MRQTKCLKVMLRGDVSPGRQSWSAIVEIVVVQSGSQVVADSLEHQRRELRKIDHVSRAFDMVEIPFDL